MSGGTADSVSYAVGYRRGNVSPIALPFRDKLDSRCGRAISSLLPKLAGSGRTYLGEEPVANVPDHQSQRRPT